MHTACSAASGAPAHPGGVPRTAIFCLAILSLASVAFGQQRPLVTEDPETIGAGRMLFEGGFDYGDGMLFPASGLEGDLLRLPLIGLSFGLGSNAELQIDGGLFNRLTIKQRHPAPLASMVTETGDTASDVEDIVVATKIRIVPEGASRPSFGVRFATRLPNAGNESGLGLDTTDFMATVLVAKTIESVRVVGNGGLGILGDPTRGDRQNDVVMYGVSLARAITQAAELVGEINGRLDVREGDPPPGTESRGQLRLGARYTIGSWRADGALLIGLTDQDPTIGVAAGFTYVFSIAGP